jgi:chloramphenicol-sensitive protein RarD
LYFKQVAQVPAVVVLAYRIVWSVVFLLILMTALRRWHEAQAVVRQRRVMLMLCFSTMLLATNWGTFIWAVSHDQALAASLGYFINPLVSVAQAMIVLKERQRVGQRIGLALAVVGVAVVTIASRQLPLVAVTLAFSFAGYALVRKVTHVGPLVGVAIETILLLPIAVAYIFYRRAMASVAIDGRTYGWLMLAGIVTVVPLLAFTAAAKRLRFATLGFLQYVGPTCQFLVAVLIFREPFGTRQLAGFACIWSALIVYSIDSWRAYAAPIVVESAT